MKQLKIKVYTTTTCPYCQSLKAFLEEREVAFEEAVVDQDPAKLEEMRAVSEGFSGVPFIVVTQDDGSVVKIKGFNREKLEEVLKGVVEKEAVSEEPRTEEETELQKQPSVSKEETPSSAPQEGVGEPPQPQIAKPTPPEPPETKPTDEPAPGPATESETRPPVKGGGSGLEEPIQPEAAQISETSVAEEGS